jgi:hypothetical protein
MTFTMTMTMTMTLTSSQDLEVDGDVDLDPLVDTVEVKVNVDDLGPLSDRSSGRFGQERSGFLAELGW